MNVAGQTPTDTRMMGVVHDALRRDLSRALHALSVAPYPRGAQRTAIGRHVAWMMDFLHAHHHGEDAALWPLVRAREPRASELVDAMEADHARVALLAADCQTAARAYADGSSDDERLALLESLRHLADAVLPHLDREEHDVMPVVSLVVSGAEWHAIDQEYYVKPKSLTQLGFEGHWLLDGLDAERARIVTHEVPPLQRFILVHGFAHRYRRYATRCWGAPTGSRPASRRREYGPAAPAARSIPRTGHAEVVVAAPIDAIWNVVSDVTRVGEWSHECRRVEWLDGATGPAPGVRFRGTNKAGHWTWSRVNEITIAEAPKKLAWRTVPTPLFPDSSEWEITLQALDQQTRIVQSYRIVKAPPLLAHVYALVVPTHRDRSTGLADDLRRLGGLAEAEDTVGST